MGVDAKRRDFLNKNGSGEMPTKPVVNRKMAMVRQCSWNAWDGWSQWSPHLSLRVPWCPMVSPCPPWRIDVFQHPSADCSASSTAWPSWKIIGVIHSSMKKHKGFFLCHQYFQKHPMSRKYHLFIISCCYLQMWSDPVIIRFWLVVWIPTLSVSLPICLG
jgi:hypothetical protein